MLSRGEGPSFPMVAVPCRGLRYTWENLILKKILKKKKKWINSNQFPGIYTCAYSSKSCFETGEGICEFVAKPPS